MRDIEINRAAETQRRGGRRREYGIDFLCVRLCVSVSRRLYLVLVVLAMICAGRALGDEAGGVPFYYGLGSRFEGQVSTLVVGVNDNAGQAVESRDRKYVSLNVDANLLNSAGVRRFRYQRGGLGFVGSDVAAQGVPVSAGNGLTPSIAGLPSEIAPPVSMLDKRGMVLVMPLER
jgi:hypothetical protein